MNTQQNSNMSTGQAPADFIVALSRAAADEARKAGLKVMDPDRIVVSAHELALLFGVDLAAVEALTSPFALALLDDDAHRLIQQLNAAEVPPPPALAAEATT